jgi:heat-inducible transcriptional repressor
MPTGVGYRLYVERLMREGRLRRIDRRSIRRRLLSASVGIDELLQRTCSLLSELSSHVGIVLAPPPAETEVRHIEFLRISGKRVLLLFVTETGTVHSRTLAVGHEVSDDDLQAAQRYLAKRFAGRTLREIRELMLEVTEIGALGAEVGRRAARQLGTRWFGPGIERGEVIVEGASRLLDHPDLSEAEGLQSLFEAFEEPSQLGRILSEQRLDSRPRVLIGHERLPEALGGCTLIAASYTSGDRPVGALGVLGPTRMEYSLAIPLVAATARATSEVITELWS